MVKPRSHLADFSAYLTLRLVGSMLLMMPTDWAVGLVRLLSRIGYWTARSRREIALDNLRQAFPGEYTPEQSNRVIRDVFEHFGIMLLEMLLMPRKVHRGNWRRLITMADPDQVRTVFSSGRRIIIVTAHHGNWELGGFWPRLLGIKQHVVVRPHDNPYIEPLMKRFREGSGGTLLSKNGGAGAMRAVLVNGGVICTIGDQDAGPRGMFVDFFGRPASTHKAIAVL